MVSKSVNVLETLFKKELIFIEVPYRKLGEAVEHAGAKMQQLNLVKATFAEAVLAREQSLPTGLKLGDYGVAIPHTDGAHVNQSAVSILVFKEPISVQSMINPLETLSTKLVFLLAVREPNGQVEVLKELMNLFKNVEILQQIEQAKEPEAVLGLINQTMESRN